MHWTNESWIWKLPEILLSSAQPTRGGRRHQDANHRVSCVQGGQSRVGRSEAGSVLGQQGHGPPRARPHRLRAEGALLAATVHRHGRLPRWANQPCVGGAAHAAGAHRLLSRHSNRPHDGRGRARRSGASASGTGVHSARQCGIRTVPSSRHGGPRPRVACRSCRQAAALGHAMRANRGVAEPRGRAPRRSRVVPAETGLSFI